MTNQTPFKVYTVMSEVIRKCLKAPPEVENLEEHNTHPDWPDRHQHEYTFLTEEGYRLFIETCHKQPQTDPNVCILSLGRKTFVDDDQVHKVLQYVFIREPQTPLYGRFKIVCQAVENGWVMEDTITSGYLRLESIPQPMIPKDLPAVQHNETYYIKLWNDEWFIVSQSYVQGPIGGELKETLDRVYQERIKPFTHES